MTRFKKELRKKGYKLECDYPYMPYPVCVDNLGGLEGIRACIENNHVVIKDYYVVLTFVTVFDRALNVIEEYW